jgi:Flp pilus assembly protein TadB
MGLADRLRRLDDRVLPRSKSVQFDTVPPLWFSFGGLWGAFLGLALVWIPRLLHGTMRLVVFVVIVCLVVTYFIRLRTWRQQHQVPNAQ